MAQSPFVGNGQAVVVVAEVEVDDALVCVVLRVVDEVCDVLCVVDEVCDVDLVVDED